MDCDSWKVFGDFYLFKGSGELIFLRVLFIFMWGVNGRDGIDFKIFKIRDFFIDLKEG